jgi:hypothetical protein
MAIAQRICATYGRPDVSEYYGREKLLFALVTQLSANGAQSVTAN